MLVLSRFLVSIVLRVSAKWVSQAYTTPQHVFKIAFVMVWLS